ncbi:MAG: TonB-dependent receptor [Chitinophagaceae bacterium]|nr:MAG: TonB-dependent receptor [Chitinophagaceae bacterium]
MSKTITLLAALLAGSTAFAQKDTVNTKVLDEVVVTANKLEQKQSTTGKVITVITKAQIEKSSGKTVAQLLNEQAGITINGALNNAGAVQTVYMRGASAGRTLILLDGIPMNDPSTITTDFDLNLFSINDLERIEVCKGAQSTLYGSDAIAGVINLITLKKDVQKAFNIKATLSQGSFATTRNNLQVYGKKDKLTYSARYARLATNGFSSAYDSTGKKNFDNDRYDGTVSNAQLAYQLSPVLSIKTFAMFSQYKAGIDAGIFTDDKDYNIHNTSFTSGAGLQYKKGKLTLTGNYQFSELTRTYRNDSLDKTSTIFENNTYSGKSQFVELYAGLQLARGITLLGGADYRFNSYNQQYFSVSMFGPYSSQFHDTSFNQKALYASMIYSSPDKKLNIELGGRYNDHSRYGNNSTYTFNPSYSINPQLRLFASASSGFKAPSLYQLSINDKLDAEKSVNYEGGISLDKKPFSTRLVYFHRRINNGIDYNYISFKYFNYIKQTVNGLEWEFTARPTDKITLSGNYTLLSSEETTQNRVTVKDTVTYNYLLRRPKHTVNLTLSAEAAKGLNLSVTGKYVSKRYDIGGYKKTDVSLDSYFILGAYADYTLNEHVRFFADLQNLTGRKFFDVRGFNSIPTMFNTGVTFNW